MTDKLSERLETLVRNACPSWHAAETIREAAELARRFEESPEAFYRGHRIRMVPDSPTPPDPGHEQEGPHG